MTTPTRKEFIAAAKAAGIDATPVPRDPYAHPVSEGVNIWRDDHRYPWATLWWPNERASTFTWGPSYEHEAPGDITVESLVVEVLATMYPGSES